MNKTEEAKEVFNRAYKKVVLKNPTPRDMIEAWLLASEYDGLVNVDEECGCYKDDLFVNPSSHCPDVDCLAGYRNGEDIVLDKVMNRKEGIGR